MVKKTKIFLLISWFLIPIFLIILFQYGFPILRWAIYWWIFLSWVLCVWHFKIRSKVSLFLAFTFFVLSALIVSIDQRAIAEIIMRISFIGIIIGFIQAFVEYKRD